MRARKNPSSLLIVLSMSFRGSSVYREFKDIDQFMDELRTLAQQRRER